MVKLDHFRFGIVCVCVSVCVCVYVNDLLLHCLIE